jgi:sodium-coupled monocarboxylate transporter 8/12
MFASVICVGIKGTIDAGGMDKVWEIANEGGRIQFNDLRVDPSVRHTLWTQLIGGIFTFVSLYAVNQTQVVFPFINVSIFVNILNSLIQVQRLLTVNSLRKAQRSLWLNWPILTALSLTTSYAGISMYSHYANCDPLLEKRIRSPDQVIFLNNWLYLSAPILKFEF